MLSVFSLPYVLGRWPTHWSSWWRWWWWRRRSEVRIFVLAHRKKRQKRNATLLRLILEGAVKVSRQEKILMRWKREKESWPKQKWLCKNGLWRPVTTTWPRERKRERGNWMRTSGSACKLRCHIVWSLLSCLGDCYNNNICTSPVYAKISA